MTSFVGFTLLSLRAEDDATSSVGKLLFFTDAGCYHLFYHYYYLPTNDTHPLFLFPQYINIEIRFQRQTMKFIAGISSTTALLCLLSWHGAQQHSGSQVNVVSAFVPSTNTNHYYSIKTNAVLSQYYSSTSLNAEAIKITMPALSSTMKEGRVVSWLKSEGDAIEAGEAIMVVESDKADMDVEAFEDGFLAKIVTQEGETAEVGAVVALIAALEGDIEAVASGGVNGDAAAAAAEPAPPAAPAVGGE